VLEVKLYFKRMGFRFRTEAGDSSYLRCVIRKTAGSRYGDDRQAASHATSREEITQTMTEMGFSAKGVTDKSFKMLGVTVALKAGMTLEELAPARTMEEEFFRIIGYELIFYQMELT
jgi:hypothetical protein